MEIDRSWADLETVLEVLKRVGFQDLYSSVPLVCKAWRRASLDCVCWMHVDMEICFSTRQEVADWWRPSFEAKMDYMVKLAVDRSCGVLLELSTRHCTDVAVVYLASRCPSIEKLCVASSPGITDSSICEVAKLCPKLIHLDLSECPNLTNFSLEQIGRNCKNLTILKKNRFIGGYDPARKRLLPPEYSRTTSPANADAEVNVLANLMPKLKHLELRYSKLSDQGLTSLLDGCSELEYLDLTGCSNLTRRALEEAEARLPKLVKSKKPPVSVNNDERYTHWRLYDERFQSGFFQF